MAARGASGAARIVLNRAAFDELTLAEADGLFELAKSIVDGADVPDAEPYGVGLVQGGAALAFVGRKRVDVYSKAGDPVKKPRAAKLSSSGITVIGGYGFPARFKETGTVKMAPEPFLTPELMAQVPDAGAFVRQAAIKRGIVSAGRRARGDVFGGGRPKA
jgi:hypothetical protein